MMTNGDPEGRIFLFYPHTNNGLFFLLTSVFMYLFIHVFIYLFIYLIIYLKKTEKVPEYAKMQLHRMTLLDVLGKIAWVR